jgi:hypothetical protein
MSKPLINIIEAIASELIIDFDILKEILKKNKIDENLEIDNNTVLQIDKLLDANSKLKSYLNKISIDYNDSRITQNINNFKGTLGQLQTLALSNKLNKINNNNDILNLIIEMLKNNIHNMNNVLKSQIGGNNNNYYNSYIKYKYKYYVLKNNINYSLS